jgi:hypothetical protein
MQVMGQKYVFSVGSDCRFGGMKYRIRLDKGKISRPENGAVFRMSSIGGQMVMGLGGQ